MSIPPKVRTDAAVLVPVILDAEHGPRLVLIRRSAGGVHGGQLAFPGGKHDPADDTMLHTALREAREEIGLAADRVWVLESLPAVDTLTSYFRVHPYLAAVVPPPEWQPEAREVEEVIEVGIDELAQPETHGEAIMHFADWPAPRRVPFYRVGGHRAWGVTYRILRPLLPRLQDRDWAVFP